MKEKLSSGMKLSIAAQHYIEDHCMEKFSLQELADTLFVNKSYLIRTFKRCTGITPLIYHQTVRCLKAAELLVNTDQSITEIGESVGFLSSSHFSHVFNKIQGCTPSEYRKMHS